jgi:hypothetical protein
VLKVLYADCLDARDDVEALTHAWLHDRGAERMDLPWETCLSLVQQLRASTLAQPPARRRLNGLSVGFLPRADLRMD